MKKVLVTGAAGFIGFYLSKKLADLGYVVIGIDNINDYYDVNLKYERLRLLGINIDDIKDNKPVVSTRLKNFKFYKTDITDQKKLGDLFNLYKFDYVCNLAAQAGVRYSLTNPHSYINSNILGVTNILECCKKFSVKHLVYASSSSVYGLNKKVPFSTLHPTNHPVSLYAASKKANELLAHSYSHLYKLPTTGLRFFTVYGPLGRPDMAYFLFTKAIIDGKPIKVFNNGKMSRDFTYIDDIVEGIKLVLDSPPMGDENWDPVNLDPSNSTAPYRVYNIGNSAPVNLMEFIDSIETSIGLKAEKIFLPMQKGDVEETWADVDKLKEEFGYIPSVSVKDGVQMFVDWYKEYYKID